MITTQIILLILLCLILIYSTGLIVRSIKSIASFSKLGSYSITAFILAIATTLPEMMVSIVAALEDKTSLILGNIIGSNIADMSLVLGGATLLGGSLKVQGVILTRDIYLTAAVALLPLFLIADGTLSRADGIVLLVTYLIMVSTFLRAHQRSLVANALSISPIKRLFMAVVGYNRNSGITKFVVGVGLLLFSSYYIVRISVLLAETINLPILFIGLFFVALGTSLPELAFAIKSVSSGHAIMAIGDLLGSVVANSTLILGIAALIRPLVLTPRGLLPYSLAIGFFVIIYLTFIFFIKSKKKLEWWEGLILLLIYVIFVFAEYLSTQI